MLICPKCSSKRIKRYKYLTVDCYQCENCGYDTCSDVASVFPESRSSQKEKGKFTPYKVGGSKRSK